MKKRLLLLLVFLLIIALVASLVYALDDEQYVCGSTPNSDIGYGAVGICGNFHACGVADGVCPEDFSSGADSSYVRGSCMNCPDVDCTAKVAGKVTTVEGFPIFNATVYQTNEAFGFTKIATTNADGYYTADATTGWVDFYAVYADYDTQIIKKLVLRDTPTTKVDIQMSPGSCTDSCTDIFGSVCKASCLGVNNCTFPNATSYDSAYTSEYMADVCDGYTPNTRYVVHELDDKITYAICCGPKGNDFITESRPKLNLTMKGTSECIRDLGTHVVKAKYKGQTVKLITKAWHSTCS